MKTDKWYLKGILVFYRIFMPIFITFLFFIAPNMPIFQNQGFENVTLIFRVIICLFMCLFYIYVPYFSKDFWFYVFPDLGKTNLIVMPNSKFFSSLLIIIRFLGLFGITEIILEIYLPLFGRYNLLAAGINALLLTIPAIAQFMAVKE
jgi:hypothetical protein